MPPSFHLFPRVFLLSAPASLGIIVISMIKQETIRIYADTSVDALHVALATVSRASLIVSWNFKHIVNFQKIPMYNAVNTLHGYRGISIYSPLEVIEYED